MRICIRQDLWSAFAALAVFLLAGPSLAEDQAPDKGAGASTAEQHLASNCPLAELAKQPLATRPKLFMRNKDGYLWQIRPDNPNVKDDCEKPAGWAGIHAGTFGGRCAYLTCRWITDLTDCVERAVDAPIGNECTEDDYERIKSTRAEANLACGLFAPT
jgi:hypothetical protein